ncbi:peptidase C39 family protein [Acidovorax sp.]|uniref:peptidase C39 family protein n=1 Tax=Acidovorax sp. TaxID=1872122 RepID=UPI0025C112C3|nr:peptidase C39 family protein [Acidovorax sp.]MBW8464652.1 peptidase C39 family protein [Acidovorax sp.]
MAGPADLPALEQLENAAFCSDRISRRSWGRLLLSPSAQVLVVRSGQALGGACVVLRREGSSVARLYSIAVAPAMQRAGVARGLLAAAIHGARDAGCAVLRLESRAGNVAAHRLFARHGFVHTGCKAAYYADGEQALCFQKDLFDGALAQAAASHQVRHYAQTLDFTCGPCALLMAMSAMDPAMSVNQAAEIRLWREATTVFMAAGHGGCGPFGLAHGFEVSVYAAAGASLFMDSVRDPRKKEVIQLVENDFRAALEARQVPIHARPVSPDSVIEQLRAGRLPIVLISLWRLHRQKTPHWVVITGFDGAVFRLLDPMARSGDPDGGVSVSWGEFKKVARYGRRERTAAVILSGKK